ncbi:putative ribonuclease H-like domain-containing protein [Tanacetum coccineum]
MSHPHPKRSFVPKAVLTRSGKLNTASAAVNTSRLVNTANTKAVNTTRPVNTAALKQTNSITKTNVNTVSVVNTAASKQTVNHPRPINNTFKRGYSQSSRPFNRYFANKNNITKTNVNTVSVKHTTARDRAVVRNKGKGANAVKASACWDNPQQKEYKEKAVIDSGCSRHMTGNKCYLDEYEDYDGGLVSFGDGKGRISGKGKIKTGTLDFEDVYFCKELKYNLFSVSQICDKKNNVLFTDTECLVLSSDFKLLDESQVLLKVPRKDNIYSVDLKSVVPTGDLTCLIAKATIDESNTWHRRLGHINFKTMNKLVKGNLVKGLPSKIFENDHSCVACQKGKQHKASYKTKLVNSISKPLHMLHMDLFGPTNVKSLMKKSYCLVVTDDFSRFSWVFFLATKDETSGILKTFITEIENQLDHKVKVIRSDNGTEFKNSIMNQFCEIKGIKREFSVARTPQQNGVAERKNRTLIEAARTMLVDSKLPTTFWAEAVNTACYVLNRVLVIKPHNKTPYELIRGRPPLIDFMKPFGCPVTILNTRDHLGKFDGKADEGYFIGYSCLMHKAYWALKHANFDLKTAGDHRKLQLNELNELRDQAYENSLIYKERTKKLHDSKIKNRIFNVGDRVLLFNSRLKIFSGKLKTRWSGPFTITKVFPYGTIELSQPDGPNFKVNGHRVKHYFGGDLPPKPGHLAARLGCAETKVATWDDLAFKLIILGYGYCKNLKKTVKAGQTRTRERKECTRAGDLLLKVRILKKSQENSQNRANTGTGTEEHTKSQEFLQKGQEVNSSNSETAFYKSVKESSLDFETKDVHAIKYKISKAKEKCMTYFRYLHSHLQVLSQEDLKGTRIEHGFKRAFMSLFDQDDETFTKSSEIESEVQDESNRSGNDTDTNDADIRHIYNEEPMTETYKDLYDFIKETRVQTKDHNDYLIEQVNKKSIKNADLKAQLQEKVFAIAALKNELRKLTEDSVDSKYSSHDMVHNHYLEKAKKKTQERDINSKTSVIPSARLQSTANGSKPKPMIMNQMTRNWPTSKSSCLTITDVPKADHSRISKVNSCAKVQSNKTRNSNKPVEQKSHSQKPGRQIFIGNRVSPNKSSVVYEKISPRSCLRWKPTSRILKTVGLRNDSYNVNDKADSLFGPMFDEYLNGENQVVSKSSAVTTADASDKRQQQQEPLTRLDIQTTPEPSTSASTVTANGNFEV